MKKVLKTLGSLALAATLTMGMFTVANATTNYTITINDAVGATDSSVGNTYSLYQVASFDVSNKVYTNIKAVAPFTTLQTELENLAGKLDDSDEAKSFANKAAGLIETAPLVDSVVVSEDDNTLDVSETGYYLVVDTQHGSSNPYLTTKYILVAVDGLSGNLESADPNEDINVKTSKAGVQKKIVSEHGGQLVDADTVAVGDTVTYQLDATIPSYASEATNISYYLTDTLSEGLTYVDVTSVTISSNGSDYTDLDSGKYSVTPNDVENGGGSVVIKITDDATLRSNTHVRVQLTATLNDSAKADTTKGNPNSVDLSYSNNYNGGSGVYITPEDTVITYTGKLSIEKKDSNGEGANLLPGAKFDIYRIAGESETEEKTITVREGEASSNVRLIKIAGIITDENGAASVEGLDVGTYYAIETEAPAGYNLDETPIALEVAVTLASSVTGESFDENNDITTIENYTKTQGATQANTTIITAYPVSSTTNNQAAETIINTAGITLPGTGGIGTTIFTFGGLALVILAAIMFIVYTRKQKKQA